MAGSFCLGCCFSDNWRNTESCCGGLLARKHPLGDCKGRSPFKRHIRRGYWKGNNPSRSRQQFNNGSPRRDNHYHYPRYCRTVLAPNDVPGAFESVVNPLMSRILNNPKESRSLATQRDALLPQLVSEEVRMGEGRVSVPISVSGSSGAYHPAVSRIGARYDTNTGHSV